MFNFIHKPKLFAFFSTKRNDNVCGSGITMLMNLLGTIYVMGGWFIVALLIAEYIPLLSNYGIPSSILIFAIANILWITMCRKKKTKEEKENESKKTN